MGLKVGEVKLEKWNSRWREDFEAEKQNLLKFFGDAVMSIYHIGSTSVKGLDAKPIIDIAVGMNKLSDFEKVRGKFEETSQYSVKLDNAPDEILIRKGPEDNRTHFIHVMEQNSERLKSSIAFRNLLQNNPEARNEYLELKRELAKRFPHDRKSYTSGKDNFIQRKLQCSSKPTEVLTKNHPFYMG